MYTSPGGPKSVQCFSDQTADETLGPWIDVRGYSYITFYVTGEGTVSSGVITFEEAAPKVFLANGGGEVVGETTGAYSSITTYSASGVTGGAQAAVHITVAAYCYVRARISTAIGGGGDVTVNCVVH